MTDTDTNPTDEEKMNVLAQGLLVAGETLIHLKQMMDLLHQKIETNEKAIQDIFNLLLLLNKKGNKEEFDEQFKKFNE